MIYIICFLSSQYIGAGFLHRFWWNFASMFALVPETMSKWAWSAQGKGRSVYWKYNFTGHIVFYHARSHISSRILMKCHIMVALTIPHNSLNISAPSVKVTVTKRWIAQDKNIDGTGYMSSRCASFAHCLLLVSMVCLRYIVEHLCVLIFQIRDFTLMVIVETHYSNIDKIIRHYHRKSTPNCRANVSTNDRRIPE